MTSSEWDCKCGGVRDAGWVVKLASHPLGGREHECRRAKANGATECFEVHDVEALLRYELDHVALRADMKSIVEYGAMASGSKLVSKKQKDDAREAVAEVSARLQEERDRAKCCPECGIGFESPEPGKWPAHELKDALDLRGLPALEGPPTRSGLA